MVKEVEAPMRLVPKALGRSRGSWTPAPRAGSDGWQVTRTGPAGWLCPAPCHLPSLELGHLWVQQPPRENTGHTLA